MKDGPLSSYIERIDFSVGITFGPVFIFIFIGF